MDASHDGRAANPTGTSTEAAASPRGARPMRHAAGTASSGRTTQQTAGWYDADSVAYHGHVDAGDAAIGDGRDREVAAAGAARDTWVGEFDH